MERDHVVRGRQRALERDIGKRSYDREMGKAREGTLTGGEERRVIQREKEEREINNIK